MPPVRRSGDNPCIRPSPRAAPARYAAGTRRHPRRRGHLRAHGPAADHPAPVDARAADLPRRLLRSLRPDLHRLHRTGHGQKRPVADHHAGILRLHRHRRLHRGDLRGLFAGTFGFGWMPDRYGRRAVFTYSLLWYSIGSAIMAFQTTPEGVLLWRFITGIGVGLEIVTIDTYVTELVPQQMRGRAIAFNQVVMFAAAPVAAILSWWLVPATVFSRRLAHRGAGRLGRRRDRLVHPPCGAESLRWLAAHGDAERSERIVSRMEAIAERESGMPLPPPAPTSEAPEVHRAAFAALWRAPYRTRLLMLVVFNFCQAIGYYGFANWVPTLLIGQGITVTKSLLYAFVIAFALPAGPLLAMRFADRIQRKHLIVGGALAVIVCRPRSRRSDRRAAHRIRRADQPRRADDLRRLSRVPVRAVPDRGAPARAASRIGQPRRRDNVGLHHRCAAEGFRRARRVHRDHRVHARRGRRHRRVRPENQWRAARGANR